MRNMIFSKVAGFQDFLQKLNTKLHLFTGWRKDNYRMQVYLSSIQHKILTQTRLVQGL